MRTRLPLLLIVGILVVLTPLAYAEPPDPSWIAGLYDDGDSDDALWHITSIAGVTDLCVRDAGCSLLVVLALLPWLNEGAESLFALFCLRPRAPPAS